MSCTKIDFTTDDINGLNITGLTFTSGGGITGGTSPTLVDASGEWSFSAGTLTYYDGTTAVTVTLTGVTTVTANGTALLAFV